jgi:hypothetical protein
MRLGQAEAPIPFGEKRAGPFLRQGKLKTGHYTGIQQPQDLRFPAYAEWAGGILKCRYPWLSLASKRFERSRACRSC